MARSHEPTELSESRPGGDRLARLGRVCLHPGTTSPPPLSPPLCKAQNVDGTRGLRSRGGGLESDVRALTERRKHLPIPCRRDWLGAMGKSRVPRQPLVRRDKQVARIGWRYLPPERFPIQGCWGWVWGAPWRQAWRRQHKIGPGHLVQKRKEQRLCERPKALPPSQMLWVKSPWQLSPDQDSGQPKSMD